MLKRSPTAAAAAPGRLDVGPPVAVVDIGSNSIRLVVYEGLSRSPTPVFNEKVLAGLGREVLSTGLLAADAVARAIEALRRFRVLCDVMGVERLWVIATAACREARNGPDFIREAQAICGTRIDVLSGKREATLSALGVVSGVYKPDGIVGDLGGGSLELVDVKGTRLKGGASLPLGGLALQDLSARSLKKADKIVDQALRDVKFLKAGSGRAFYAVGGTWRALTRLHMRQTGYPLHVMQNYVIPAREALEFVRLVRRVNADTLSQIESVNEFRRPLLAYAAVVLEHIIRTARPREIVVSAAGVREGLLYSALGERERRKDPLLAAAMELNVLRSRSPAHALELVDWTDRFMASTGIDETADEKRLRHAACLLGDIGWRAHPDYRGEQSLNVISHANFLGVDHPGRTFVALAVYFRHAGLFEGELSPGVRELVTARMIDRARVLGGAMRVAYLISAAMPGILPSVPMVVRRGQLQLVLREAHAALGGERIANRLRQLARLIGREPLMVTG
ncbi:exopolyphosphatase [Rhodoplanes sp. TEM]|uniref:exopolyphosphatase n=1 Tax=Rhodoplanes tepidamans TaxID=200616 RepID=A0ABT5JES3_RHOTP|nr:MULTISPECIES: exopolyphosphatase [Rhodoplanes]MDC7787774.1 exopolyphosphatase [Rhodoplanes tepidamans]MDC7982663.1 exopolyphosphatase [Rhodoplanes sp. TEM]MDQ0357690.1 exopolyphosphatase/guanosine-5'-triphosphate,3'-diphosphate pyrophosphatase [Rhodoplanes tepidamans]